MIVENATFKPQIKALFELANTSLNPSIFKAKCETFAKFDESGSDDSYWRFQVGEEFALLVGIDTNGITEQQNREPQVTSAILSFCWWESFSKSDHKTIDSYDRERERFDQLFKQSLEETVNILGQPLLTGKDADEMAHKYAIWRGKTCLLILQQSAYDLQFGLDLNYWIQTWSGADPEPTSPLIEWLFIQGEKTEE